MENYRVFGKIGEGAPGTVFQAEEIATGHKVALKKLSLKKIEDGIPIQFFREIKTLQHCAESDEPGSEFVLRLRSERVRFFFQVKYQSLSRSHLFTQF